MSLLIEYNKKFLIIVNQNNITKKEIFPLIKENKIWLGCRFGDMSFRVPDYYKPRATRFWIDNLHYQCDGTPQLFESRDDTGRDI